jgi:hypothetical protein
LLNHTELYNILIDPTKYGSSNTDSFNDFIESEKELRSNLDEIDSEIWMFLLVAGNYTGISTVEGVEFRPVKYNIGRLRGNHHKEINEFLNQSGIFCSIGATPYGIHP